MKFDREQLAWAAGFFDGEANFITCKHNKDRTKRFIIQVGQKHPEVLERLQTIFPKSKISGPYIHRGKYRFPKKSYPTYYRWAVNDFEYAQFVVGCVWPWLDIIKQKQIKSALLEYKNSKILNKCKNNFFHTKIKTDKRGNQFCSECRSLNTYKSWQTRKEVTP